MTNRVKVGRGGHIVVADANAGAVGCREDKIAVIGADGRLWGRRGEKRSGGAVS